MKTPSSCYQMTDLIVVVFLQSARMRAAGVGKDFKENPNLRDNWTDAEGYYSKCCLPNPYLFSDVIWRHACDLECQYQWKLHASFKSWILLSTVYSSHTSTSFFLF